MQAVTGVILNLFLGGGVVALALTIYQLAVRRRAHVLELYRQAFAMMDGGGLNEVRDYVHNLKDRDTYEKENWLALDPHRSHPNYALWKEHRDIAERVARSFDQLGLLVREGYMPVNVVASFYAFPALRCWHNLQPYINAIRSARGRTQRGHMWEWQNLVFGIMIPGLKSDTGVWRGVSAHDNLQTLIQETEREFANMIKDSDYKPGDRAWVLRPWYHFRWLH